MPHRQPMSPRDDTAVIDNRLVGTVRRSMSAACSQRSSGKVDWSFEAGLLRFQGKYEQEEEMQRPLRPVKHHKNSRERLDI